MANIIRSAKSGNDWSGNELVALNIPIESVDAAIFFGRADLPPLSV
jgi:NADH dehydrogenase (ubiquinone) flavoprotein 1